ncbi:hypothetical protein D9M71_115750 [compost metagenome]
MNISLGCAWEGWAYEGTGSHELNGEMATFESLSDGQYSLMRRAIPVCAGEVLEFSLLAQRLWDGPAETSSDNQRVAAIALDYYDDAGQCKRNVHENIYRSALEEYRLTFMVPMSAGSRSFVNLLVGTFKGPEVKLAAARPRLNIRDAVYGVARVVACGRLLQQDSQLQFDSGAQRVGVGQPERMEDRLLLSVPRLAQQPRVDAQLDWHPDATDLMVRTHYDRIAGQLTLVVVSARTGLLISPADLPAGLAISVTCST